MSERIVTIIATDARGRKAAIRFRSEENWRPLEPGAFAYGEEFVPLGLTDLRCFVADGSEWVWIPSPKGGPLRHIAFPPKRVENGGQRKTRGL
jgi:hypothetical protein